MNLVFLNNIVPIENLRYPINYRVQIKEILSIIDSKINKTSILKMTVYYTTRDCYDDIYSLCKEWVPQGLEVEYIGNYTNYNPLIHIMVSIIALKEQSVIQNKLINPINYII